MKINKNMSPDSKNNVRNIESGLRKAFTLVELIVVITILAILGTIAFLSFQGYSRDARDSKRTSDLSNIKTSLELSNVNTGKYPKPDSFSTITYSGGTENVWYQGFVGDQVTTNLKQLNEKPLDPLTNAPYIYSVTNSYKEYEVLALYEGNIAYNPIINQTNAATTSLIPKIDGNYNGVYVKTKHYIIPVPSIVISEEITPGSGKELTPESIKSLVTTNGTNIPKTTVSQTSTGGLSNLKLSVYTGSITKASTDAQKVNLIKQIQQAYTGTVLSSQNNIAYILNKTSNQNLLDFANNTVLKYTPVPTKKTVLNCIDTGEIIYGTLDGTDVGLTCSDDIMVCSGAGAGYTISACNVGATEVALSDDSNRATSYGGLYQWGNNYDSRGGQFYSFQVYPIVITNQITSIPNYSTYSSTGFIQGFVDWTSLDNNGILRSTNWNLCTTGYHIPTNADWVGIVNSMGGYTQSSYNKTNQLKMPLSGARSYNNASLFNLSVYGDYWSSSTDGISAYGIHFDSIGIYPNGAYTRAQGYAIRCFKN